MSFPELFFCRRRGPDAHFSGPLSTGRVDHSIVRPLLASLILISLPGIPSFAGGVQPLWAESGPHFRELKPSVSRVLTLEQAIRLALERNPGLAKERAILARSSAFSVRAGELSDPKIILGEQYFPIDLGMGESALAMTTVGIRQSFPPWGKRSLLRQSAVFEATAARWRLEDKKNRLVRDVRMAWVDLYRAREKEVILRSAGSLREQAFRSALARYRQGTGSESDVLLAQFQKDRIRDRKEQVRIREEKSLYRLMDLMHVSRSFRIPPEKPHFPDPLPESVLLGRLDRHPELESRNEKNSAQELLVRAAEKDKIPAVSVEGDYSYFMGPNLITATPNLFSLLLSFNLPVRPGERQDQRVAEKRHELEILESDRDAARQRLIEEVRNSEGTYRHLLRRTDLLEHVLMPEAKRSVDAALAGYATGTLEMERVLSTMQKAEKVELQALSVEADRLKTDAELSYLSGRLQGGPHEP